MLCCFVFQALNIFDHNVNLSSAVSILLVLVSRAVSTFKISQGCLSTPTANIFVDFFGDKEEFGGFKAVNLHLVGRLD